MPAARVAGPAQGTRARHSAKDRPRLSTRELVALLRTLPQLRMPNHLWAQLAAIPYTNVVDGGDAPHARGSTGIRGSSTAGVQRKGAVSERLTYQETLRTVGTLLEHAGADAAVIALAPDSTEAILPTWRSPRVWDVDALQ